MSASEKPAVKRAVFWLCSVPTLAAAFGAGVSVSAGSPGPFRIALAMAAFAILVGLGVGQAAFDMGRESVDEE